MDFTENLFTVPKIDIEEIEKAAYDRGYADAEKSMSYEVDQQWREGYDAGYTAGQEAERYSDV